MLSVLKRITQNIFNIEKRLKFQFPLDCSSIFKYWIDFFVIFIGKYIYSYQSALWMGLWCLYKHRHPLMSQVIGQMRREVAGCHNCPVMRVPLYIGLRGNGHWVQGGLVRHSGPLLSNPPLSFCSDTAPTSSSTSTTAVSTSTATMPAFTCTTFKQTSGVIMSLLWDCTVPTGRLKGLAPTVTVISGGHLSHMTTHD